MWLPFAAGENGNVPKCAAGCVGFLVGVCTVLASRGLVAYNVLQLQEVGDFYHKCSYGERMFVPPQNCHTKH